MRDWLNNKNIAYGEGDTIPQLLLKVKLLDVPKVFEIEHATEEYCKKINRSWSYNYLLRIWNWT